MLWATHFPRRCSSRPNFNNVAYNPNFTSYNANKAIQFDQDLACFKSGWGGTHNFKFGYQLNRLSNDISSTTTTRYDTCSCRNVYRPTNRPRKRESMPPIALPFVALYGQCQGLYG